MKLIINAKSKLDYYVENELRLRDLERDLEKEKKHDDIVVLSNDNNEGINITTKISNRRSDQGDVEIKRINALPKDLRRVKDLTRKASGLPPLEYTKKTVQLPGSSKVSRKGAGLTPGRAKRSSEEHSLEDHNVSLSERFFSDYGISVSVMS